MAYIDIIEQDRADGRLKEIYEDLVEKRGKLAQVHKIQSLNPESIVSHMDLYMTVMFGSSPLSRAQREMIAVVVSATNHCEYCQLHHGEALMRYWKDEARVNRLRTDFHKVNLEHEDLLLCELAVRLTEKPGEMTLERDIVPLKEAGFSDRAVLDAVLVIGYFNFVNRMVTGLGVESDPEEVKGYKY